MTSYTPQHTPDHCEGTEAPCSNTNAEWVRTMTAYVDDELNWAYLCPECQKHSDEYWEEMWEEYNSGRL